VKYECKKWHHSEIRIAINDESQGSIAKNLRCDELLYYIFISHSAGERIFNIGEHSTNVICLITQVRIGEVQRLARKIQQVASGTKM